MHDMESKAAFEKKLKKKGVLDEFKRRVKFLIEKDEHNPPNAYSKARREFNDLYFPKKPSGASDIVLPPWCNLNRQSFNNKDTVTTRQAVDWAIENVAFKNVKPKDAPSATAWLYLQRFRSEPAFLNEVLKKRVPTVSKIEQDKGYNDDERDSKALIEKLQRELESSGSDAVLPLSTQKRPG